MSDLLDRIRRAQIEAGERVVMDDLKEKGIGDQWNGHAPDLVRDNRLLHERLAEQDREIARLTELLRMAESKAIPVAGAHHCETCQCPEIEAMGSMDPKEWVQRD